MQHQLLFVEMFSLAEFPHPPLLLVLVLEGCAVFLTCEMLCSWGRAWKQQGSEFLPGPPQHSCCCAFGQKSVGTGWGWGGGSPSTGLVRRAARYLCCTSNLAFLEEPQRAGGGIKGMFPALLGAVV